MNENATTRVTLATATPGGGFPLYGGAVAEVINAVDPALRVECLNTKGSTENVPLLAVRKVDLGLVTGEVAFAEKTDLRILAAMYSTAGMFVVRGDGPARSIRDLVGQPVAFGARGSGLVILARFVLDGMGLDMERDFTAIYLDRAGDGPDMVLDGRAAALWGGGIGWPGFARVAESGGRFIAPSGAEVAQVRARHAFLKPLTVPAGAYPGQDAPIHSVGSWSFVMARPDLPDETGYRLAKALHKGEAQLAAKLEQAKETTAANTAAAAPEPSLIHPGVAAYLREIGVL
ncbi:MAG TPA: TAXI family TRAP transporter solute-binding subunit [Stellaceae bacterium]|nr:TAXI family TRAP transporter solute-binding subunit [Stellaceae bacterium]